MIVATAGHVDHGKTALVRALTGVDTDRLPEEKARGISIDLGFAHCTLDGVTLGFVDVPGHERFVRNMLSGVHAVGHVLLVVAADDGVMPQTREHLHIVSLLGLAGGTVVITKKDRVGEDRLAQAVAEARALVRGGFLAGAPVLCVSAQTGEGMQALRERLLEVASTPSAREAGGLARFVVDRVFTVTGSGTVATGAVTGGEIAAGDMLVISPGGRPARVRKLQRHGRTSDRAVAGERCALNLAGVSEDEVRRGDWVVAADAHHPSDCIDVRLELLAAEARPLRHWTPLHLHIGAADVPARLALRRGAAIAPGESALARLHLVRPVHAVFGDRFIVRDQSATRTLGGGAVVNPHPAPVRRAQRDGLLAALEKGLSPAGIAQLLRECPDGFSLRWLAQVFNLPAAAIAERMPSYAVLLEGPQLAFSDRRIEQLQQGIVERIGRFHAQYRELGGIELAQLHRELACSMPIDVFTALCRLLAERAGLHIQGSRVRMLRHDSTDNPRDLLAWQRIRPLLVESGAAIPSVREMAVLLKLPLQELRDLLHRKAARAELVKLTAERFALPETMAMLAAKARQAAEGRPAGLFSAANFRDSIGTGRTLAIEILECLDRQGATQRRGDLRSLRGL